MASSTQILQALKKNLGDKVGSMGMTMEDVERIPTGMFAFDLATGGGFPRRAASLVYGPESSGKSNLILLAIAKHQLLWPNETCIFIDVENSFNPDWAKLLGVHVDRLIIARPDFADQVVDMVEGFLDADDCGIVALDSIAALITEGEANKPGEAITPGGASALVGKMVRKATLCMRKASKEGRSPSLLMINQNRFKIGQMFGNPETTPGGQAPKFASALTVRVSGKNVIDNKVSKVLPIAKETNFIIQKWKVPITAINGMFAMTTVPHDGLKVGEADDFNTVAAYLKKMNLLTKGEQGKGWIMLGETYPTILAARERLYTDKLFGSSVRKALIEKVIAAGVIEPEDDTAETAE